jgi:anti-repressor protein
VSELTPYIFQGKDVRVVTIDGAPWWVHADVCHKDVLDIKNPADAIKRLDDDEYMQVDSNIVSTDVATGGRDPYVINESGLYSLIMGSRKKVAKDFKRWVTHEVLPAIRQTGSYGTPEVDRWSDHPDMLATRRWLETNERVERVEVTLDEHGREIRRVTETTTRLENELMPKAELHDQLMASRDTYTLKEVADRFGLGNKGRQILVNDLRARGILCQPGPKGGTQAYAHYYRAPTAYFVQKLIPRPHSPRVTDEAVEVTPQGLAWLAKMYGK